MKKIYLLLALLPAFGSVQAAELPMGGATPKEAPVCYIQNTRNVQNYVGALSQSKFDMTALVSERHQFKFITADGGTAEKPAFKIYSVALDAYINDVSTGAVTENMSEAATWYVFNSPYAGTEGQDAFAISKDMNGETAWNNEGGNDSHVAYYTANDPGSCWWIKSGDEIFQSQKTAYATMLDGLEAGVGEANLYVNSTRIAAAKAALAADDADMQTIIDYATGDKLVNTSATGLYRISNGTADNRASAAVEHKTVQLTNDNKDASRAIWRFIIREDGGSCYIQNYLTGEYLQAFKTLYAALETAKTPVGFTITRMNDADGKVALRAGNNGNGFVHLDGRGNMVGWANDGDNSRHKIVSVEETELETAAAKELALAQSEAGAVFAELSGASAILNVSAKEYSATSLNDYLDGFDRMYQDIYQQVAGNIYRFYATRWNRYLAFNDAHVLYLEETDKNVLNQLWTLVPAGRGFKLKSLNLDKCADNLAAAPATTAFVDDETNAGVYSITDVNGSDFTIKNNGNVLRKENGDILNYWGPDKNCPMNIELVEYVDIDLNAGGDGKSYATAYLPFAVSSVEGAKAYTASAPANGRMELTEAANGVAVNTGVILISDVANPSATLVIGENENAATGSALLGTTVAKPVEANSVLTLGLGSETNEVGFFLFSGTELRANSAYLDANEAGASALVFSFGGDTDGVQGIEAAAIARDGKVYDLSGRRVGKAGKGIYIVNGKKMIK